jgi:SAM-dependent methyltransferase
MSAQDRVRWDAIYREHRNWPFPPPDPLLLSFTPHPPDDRECRALDLACGLGQNGLWLAGQGYIVDMMDISRAALSRAREEMAIRNLRSVNLLQVDIDELDIEEETYYFVCVFRYLKRDLFRKITAAVQPGGRIIYETFNTNYLQLVPEFNRAFLLDVGELVGYFDGWQILHHSDEGHISQVVALKPEQSYA